MQELATPISQKFHDALAYASAIHAGQSRKGVQIPYVAHLLTVAGIVLEAGADEDEAIAALLHDGPEDQGGTERLNDIRRLFGDRVAAIVDHCSDTFEMPKPPWVARKAAYAERLAHADVSTLLVSVADKLHNAQSTLRDLSGSPEAQTVWARFSATREQTIGNYRSLIAAYRRAATDRRRLPLVAELERTVDAMESNF